MADKVPIENFKDLLGNLALDKVKIRDVFVNIIKSSAVEQPATWRKHPASAFGIYGQENCCGASSPIWVHMS